MSNIDELKLRALGIKEEVREGANTANRVGGLFYDIIDSMGGNSAQHDWNQNDSTQPDFIKNKPNIPSTAGLASEQYVRNYTYDKQTIDDKIAQGGTFDPTNYYTKREIDAANIIQDNEIAKKANTSSLATVATSGNYNDLSGKPTIPAAQVQSDWNQTNAPKRSIDLTPYFSSRYGLVRFSFSMQSVLSNITLRLFVCAKIQILFESIVFFPLFFL